MINDVLALRECRLLNKKHMVCWYWSKICVNPEKFDKGGGYEIYYSYSLQLQ